LSDFYRELGDIFSISIRVSNRWGGFKALRARWLDHLGSAARRPVVLIDEAQEMTPMVLSELRLLASARFDSQALLCVVLSGDARLLDKLRRDDLVPLGSRIRTRLATGAATREELLTCPIGVKADSRWKTIFGRHVRLTCLANDDILSDRGRRFIDDGSIPNDDRATRSQSKYYGGGKKLHKVGLEAPDYPH